MRGNDHEKSQTIITIREQKRVIRGEDEAKRVELNTSGNEVGR